MDAQHAVAERAGKTTDVLTDEAGGFRLTVARSGAEPVGIARRNPDGEWTGFLWRDGELGKNPDGWSNHATVMGFYVARLKDERSLYRGREIRGGTHSFLRHKTFAAPEVGARSLTYTMEPEGYEAHEYPGRVRLRLTYTLGEAGALDVRFRFENLDEEQPAHVSFGLHPGLAVGSLEQARVLLPPGRYARLLAPGNFLSGETESFEHPGGPMPFAKADLPGSFLLDLGGVEHRTFTLEDPAGGRRVELGCQEAPYLTIWSDGNPFVCVEPCWGMPDAHAQTAFEDKVGIQVIAAGGTLERGFGMRFGWV